jgi:cysteine desulfurase family protein (TIGR01976 family)
MILASSPHLPIDFVRSQFPALDGYSTFMDNAGGTQMLQSVINRVVDYWLSSNVQLGGNYTVSLNASDRFYAAVEDLAELIQAPDPRCLVFGGSASLLFRILAQSLGQTWQPGDEVIVTNSDHEANISPWIDLQAQGIVVKIWPIDLDRFCLNLKDLEPLITDRTRLIACGHASHILGSINPLAEIIQFAHDRQIKVCVDGVAYAPHRQLLLKEWDVDFYVFSFYKVFGTRQSILFGQLNTLEALPGFNHYFIQNVPDKFQPGGVSYDLTYGNLGFCDYLEDLGSQLGQVGKPFQEVIADCFQVIANHEQDLAQRLIDGLGNMPKVTLVGLPHADLETRIPTIAFTVKEQSPIAITEALSRANIGVRHGHFYAQRLIQALNLTEQGGVVRVSLAHYNTVAEIEHLLETLTNV